MSVDPNTIRKLIGRGVELRPPVSGIALTNLGKEYSINIGTDFKSVYSFFDGFLVHDNSSMFMLWSIDQIIAAKDIYKHEVDGSIMIPIGDYLMESDVLVARIFDESANVRLLYEERDLASSIGEFLSLIAEGKFDLH